MISIATHFRPERAVEYFRSELALPSHLLEPSWLGNFAAMLDLRGPIANSSESLTVLDRLARGCSPSGVPLLAGVMRCPERPRRSSYDIVVSAPKTVSVAALVAEDTRIFAAHLDAVQTAFEEMQLRAGISSHGTKRDTNSLVAAHFVHTLSRENDPHLHSHILTFNMTYTDDPSLYSVKALDPKRIFADSLHLDAIYKNDLAYGLRQLGHEVEVVKGSPEIPLVGSDARALFSKAQRKIDRLEAQVFGTRRNPRHGIWVNDRFRRRKYPTQESQTVLADKWRQEMAAETRAKLLDAVRAANTERGLESPARGFLDPRRAVRQAKIEASKKTLFLTSKLIWKHLWPLVMGQLPWVELKKLIAEVFASAHPIFRPMPTHASHLSLAQKADAVDLVVTPQLPKPKKSAESKLTQLDYGPIVEQSRGFRPTL